MNNKNLKPLLLGLYKMALSDGYVAPEELSLLYQIGKNYGLTDEEVNNVIHDDSVVFLVPDTLNEKVTLLYRFTEMAWADGVIKDEEIHLLKEVAIRYGFLKENADAIAKYFIEKVKQNVSAEKVIEEITNNL